MRQGDLKGNIGILLFHSPEEGQDEGRHTIRVLLLSFPDLVFNANRSTFKPLSCLAKGGRFVK
jgi:hypothetical protein